MSMQDVRDLMSADYRKYVAEIIARHPAQAQNSAHYAAFETAAQLGAMKRNVRLKSGTIPAGRVVFYTPSESAGFVTVWWQGCMCPASVKASAVKAM